MLSSHCEMKSLPRQKYASLKAPILSCRGCCLCVNKRKEHTSVVLYLSPLIPANTQTLAIYKNACMEFTFSEMGYFLGKNKRTYSRAYTLLLQKSGRSLGGEPHNRYLNMMAAYNYTHQIYSLRPHQY